MASGQSRFLTFESYLPDGTLDETFFKLGTRPVPRPEDGQVLLRPVGFSLDPAMRGQLSGRADFALVPPPAPGEALSGPAIGRVVESRHGDHAVGDLVSGVLDWADHAVWPRPNDWMGLTRVDPRFGKPSHAFGVYGINGVSAYFGIVEVARPRPGETVLVSAAAGSVGSLAGQIAKIHGARVIGLAGTADKRELLTSRLGFDATLDYRAADLADQLRELAPAGPDVYFDNVGGALSQLVMTQMRRPARVVECGQIATYNDSDAAWTVDIRAMHSNGLRFEGFTPALFLDEWPAAVDQLLAWVQDGRLVPLETELHGLESLPRALSGLFAGRNVGKMVVTVPE